VDRARTRGHPIALVAIEAMIRGTPPHAILLSGPGGVGKTTLALDLAAGLLCLADPAERPCRTCRGCRLVEHGDHPDVHRLAPAGPGGQIVIGGPEAPFRGVRDLIGDLSLRSLEGGRRFAIVESAHRMNEDAQGALLKTLEEPPEGVTIILCADDDARLLPTVRSRCARIRLGPVGVREIETILVDAGAADAPTAARVARLAGGRPGIALAYALAPDALRARAELARTLLDLLDAGPAARLAAVRTATPVALTLAAALEVGSSAARLGAGDPAVTESAPKRRRSARAPIAEPTPADPTADAGSDEADIEAEPGARAIPPAQRRRGAESLVGVAIDIARDLALAGAGGTRSLHSVDLLEELIAAAAALPPGAAIAALGRAERAAEAIAANVNPELVLDDLVLAWPRRSRAA
jgi:DNA polymerase-3 subunit delta'